MWKEAQLQQKKSAIMGADFATDQGSQYWNMLEPGFAYLVFNVVIRSDREERHDRLPSSLC